MPSRPEDYDVLLTIGAGSYGRCQKVRRKADGKVLVWKELDYGSMTESEKQMLVSEVNLLRELKHPNIVRYYDRIIDRTNTMLYIVMEFCEGGDLSTLIAKCTKERLCGHVLEEFIPDVSLANAGKTSGINSSRTWSHSPKNPQKTMDASHESALIKFLLPFDNILQYKEAKTTCYFSAKCIQWEVTTWHYLDENFVLRVLTQLTLALKECHRRSDGGHTVLHRDLKPANIFLDGKKNVKLGDFGLARILHHDTSFAKTFVGTPYYMSPEQINRMSYNEKSDIWSLGCLLYELCALSPPFTAFNQKELAEKIREGKFRRIPYRYSDQLNELITKMLNLKDYCRPSVEEILQNTLIADLVSEEQGRILERRGRRSGEQDKVERLSGTPVNELKLKEQQLQERERALKEREYRLEQRERELCVRERLAEDKLARAENLMKNYNLLKEQKLMLPSTCPDDEVHFFPTRKKKVQFGDESKENDQSVDSLENFPLPKEKGCNLKKRLYAANLRAQALCELEKHYQLKSRQLLGMR